MYLHHELREVAGSRQTEALERISTLHHLMQQSPGFIRSLACRYLGNVTQYVWLRLWQSAEDHSSFRQTEEAKAFGLTRPDGLYWPLPMGIATDGHWLSVLEGGDHDARAAYLLRLAFSVPGEASEDFVQSRRTLDRLVLNAPGIVSVLTFKSESEGSKDTFLSLVRMDEISAYRNFLEMQPAASTLTADDGIGELLATECYEVVEELTGSSVRFDLFHNSQAT